MEQEAADRGRLSLVCATHGDETREDALVQMMREQHAAAVVLVGGAVQDDAYLSRMAGYAAALDAASSRLVLVGRPSLPDGLPVTVVDYDNRGGAFRPPTTCCPRDTGASSSLARRLRRRPLGGRPLSRAHHGPGAPEDLGRTAVRLALEREQRLAADNHVVLSTRLVIRQSVRPLR